MLVAVAGVSEVRSRHPKTVTLTLGLLAAFRWDPAGLNTRYFRSRTLVTLSLNLYLLAAERVVESMVFHCFWSP